MRYIIVLLVGIFCLSGNPVFGDSDTSSSANQLEELSKREVYNDAKLWLEEASSVLTEGAKKGFYIIVWKHRMVGIGQLLLMIGFIILSWFMAKKGLGLAATDTLKEPFSDIENQQITGIVITVIGCIIGLIDAISVLSVGVESVTKIVIPEYYALKELISIVK